MAGVAALSRILGSIEGEIRAATSCDAVGFVVPSAGGMLWDHMLMNFGDDPLDAASPTAQAGMRSVLCLPVRLEGRLHASVTELGLTRAQLYVRMKRHDWSNAAL